MNLVTISGVRAYVDNNGLGWLNLEDSARGLGITTVATSGNDCVRWKRVDGYLKNIGYIEDYDERPEFIPENIFYRLAMKASNAVAVEFQTKVCNEILPSIRKTGSYNAPMEIPSHAQALRLAADTLEELEVAKSAIAVLEPKAKAFDVFLDSKGYYSVGTAAKMIGMGRNGLLGLLRNYCYLNNSNEPYQSWVNTGYFAVKGNATYVSPKGVQWLAEKFVG